MKKTMFITSVIMVVVMAIALTTSSLAWFTADGSATVETTQVTIQATASSSTGLLLSQSLSSGYSNTNSTSRTLVDASGSTNSAMSPLAPVSAATRAAEATNDNNILVDALYNASFTGAKINASGNAAVYSQFYTTGYYKSEIYAANAGDAVAHIAVDVIFENLASTSAKLYVAVLAQKDRTVVTDSAANYELVRLESVEGGDTAIDSGNDAGKWAGAEVTTVKLAADALTVDDTPGSGYDDITVAGIGTTTQPLALRPENASYAASGTQKFVVVAWYDPDTLVNNNSGNKSTVKFEIRFTSAA